MTKKERDAAFRKARTAALRTGTRIQRDTAAELLRLLAEAQTRVAAILAGTPSDYQAFVLPQLQRAINAAMQDIGGQMGVVVDASAAASWQAGIDLIDKPLAAGSGLSFVGLMPEIDTGQLLALRTFATDRIKDVSLQLANQINTELGLVTIGAQTTGDAIGKVEGLIKEGGRRRAITIVRDNLGRAFSVATQARMDQAQQILPGLQKQWRRSGKLHSRPSHDAADGQIVAVDQPFIVDGIPLMHPRDPAAPLKETINCGCESLPYMSHWDMANPKRKPFTPQELAASQFRRELQDSVPLRDVFKSS